MTPEEKEAAARENTKKIAAEYLDRGDALGWFEAIYKNAAGDNEQIPWADLQPNRYFRAWAEQINLRGNGRKALVVGGGLGDDARYLHELGFKVTMFDISVTATEWARKILADVPVEIVTADLFNAPKEWSEAFDFVLEIYTIQPLPLELRPQTIDAIAEFVTENGKLIVVTRGREDDEEPLELPWALSRKDLSRFDENNLKQIYFGEMFSDDKEDVIPRFVIEYEKV